jgi:negative regulator of genetic competence, sporulation and motility
VGERSELIQALAKATLEFKSIGKQGKAKVRTKSGAEYSYEYATLDDIINATSEALSNNGLTLSHKTVERDGESYLVSRLRHESGCKPDKTKSKIDKYVNDGYMSAVQAYGSIITYLKRYHIGMLLNIAIDEDNDGKDIGKSEKKEKQKEQPQEPSQNTEIPVFIARINEIENIFELNGWVGKHTPDLKKLNKADQETIRKLLSKRRIELQAKSAGEPEPELDMGGADEHNPPA